MQSERWKRIDEIIHAALEREPSSRAAYLVEVCKEDDLLLAEVREKLKAHDKNSTLFEVTAADPVTELVAQQDEYATSISHYQILKKIRSGGMGDVYLAEDTRLNRKVALKLLPSQFTRDRERVKRFEREARAVSALNHPNILTVYDIGQIYSSSFIVSEYIDGETLRHRMWQSRMPVREILDIGIQIAEALDAAHQAGIIHRDIKPENIMLRRDGYVKVLDFGLAKLTGTQRPLTLPDVETLSSHDTLPGIVVGTVRYMSPEQAQGLKVDSRSDIFSLGVVLYEMITGKPPFDGANTSDVVVAIVERYPSPLRNFVNVPEEVQWIVTKALAKNTDERYQTAKDLLTDLKRLRKQLEIQEELRRSDPYVTQISQSSKSQSLLKTSKPLKIGAWLTGMGALLVILIAIIYLFMRPAPMRSVPVPEYHRITFSGKASQPSISPDGKLITYISGSSLIVQDVAGGQPLELYKNENSHLDDAQPRWSPDGSQIAFTMHSENERGVYIINKLGGTLRRIASQIYFPAWSADGKQLALCYQSSKEIIIKDLLTGNSRSIPSKGQFTWIRDLDWSSNGQMLLLTFDEKTLMYQIWIRNPSGSEHKKIVEDSDQITSARWAADGKAVYYLVSKENTKNLVKVAAHGKSNENAMKQTLLSGLEVESAFTISRDGKQLAYSREFSFSNLWIATREYISGNKQFKTKQLTIGTSSIYSPSFSPDGTRVAFSLGNSTKSNIYVMELSGGSIKQLTFMDSFNTSPSWSPDGKSIAFAYSEGKKRNVWIIQSDGDNLREFSGSKLSETMYLVWYPGHQILYQLPENRNFHLLNPETGNETQLLKDESRGWIFMPRYSWDGSKIAAFWNRKPSRGLCIISLIDSKEEFLKEGSFDPIGWSADGNWVYVINEEHRLSKVSTLDGKTVPLPDLPFKDKLPVTAVQIDMSKDEQSFVINVPEKYPDVWIVENFDPEASHQP